jgi:2-keto-4-pentenoate hydratase/2-oxohepta-3-ene-1,7-dioic acid hydratase in catechol pathway
VRLVTFSTITRLGGDDPTLSPGPGSLGAAGLGLGAFEDVHHGAHRLGAILGEGPRTGAVVDLNRALAVKLAFADAGAPEAEADVELPSSSLDFVRHLPGSLDAARRALDFVTDSLARYDAPDLVAAGIVLPRKEVRLAAPLLRPGKIVGVDHNYPDPAGERDGRRDSSQPVLFLKPPTSVIGPEDEIALPAVTRCVDYEGELAVVIGRPASRIERDQARSCIAGYCVANDVTARDFENTRGQHFLGKFCDTFAPLGPALVTADEIADPQDLSLRTQLSGELVQSARTSEMRFPIDEIIAFASKLVTLEPGDVILTGTPAGVGAGQVPQRWLRDGDVVEIEIEQVGRLVNHVRKEKPA